MTRQFVALIVLAGLVWPSASATAEQFRKAAPRAEKPVDAVTAPTAKHPKASEFEKQAQKILKRKVNAQTKNMEKQFRPQFQQLVRAERAFVTRVCDMTKTQRKDLAKAAELCLKVATREFATAQTAGRQRVRNVQRGTPPNPRQLVRDWMAKAVEHKLPVEQASRYALESLRRNASHRKFNVTAIVARLDEELVLNEEQREQLIGSLSANWRDGWGVSPEMVMSNNNQFLPAIPDPYIVPLLNDDQKTVWKGAQKQNQNFWGFVAPVMVFVGEDFIDDEEDEAEEAEEAQGAGAAAVEEAVELPAEPREENQ